MINDVKTNAVRILDAKKIKYELFHVSDEAVDGLTIAKLLNASTDEVFKTLVTMGASKEYYVFMIPVAYELDLKKASKAVKEKSIEMIKSKDLLPVTGYVHGGCSPIGMKKSFKTLIDESATLFGEIYFSAGHIGYQLKMNPNDLKIIVPFTFADLTK